MAGIDGSGPQCGGLGGDAAGDSPIISPIMLRFRPIAPKPANGTSFFRAFPVEASGGAASRKRTKRKYRVRVRKKSARDGMIGRSGTAGTGGVGSGAAATLQLLPGGEEDRTSAGVGSADDDRGDSRAGIDESGIVQIGGEAAGATHRTVVESRVTVGSVGRACMGSGGSLEGRTDVEKLRVLELDTCPAFATDSLNRVRWVNAAYTELVTGGGERWEEVEVRVVVVVEEAREELPWRSGREFACQVRVEHTWRNGRYSKLVPCDVWRLGWGGFAWRLDVKAALSLGF
ncbi:hypothetical protein SAY86_002781 [Trapa natans]|uniref:DUF7950 domain-containing protein n=1 Tax=Trapa natans TaxID=22666 RepID=A0AAN7R1B7_TRANT|nr:hypothetical protein SAY86_002781 [Trapa natans]